MALLISVLMALGLINNSGVSAKLAENVYTQNKATVDNYGSSTYGSAWWDWTVNQ